MSDSIRYSNFAQSNLIQAVTAEDTVINLSDDTSFPEGFFTCVIWSASESSPMDDVNRELVLLKRTSAGVFDAVRGIEGTTPAVWGAGSKIANIITAGSMDFIHDAAHNATSITDVYDNTYNMTRGDTNIFFHFADEGENSKSIVLPELALCEGLLFRITSKAFKITQKVRLTPFTDDLFAHTSNSYMDVHKGMTMELLATASGWMLMDSSQPDFTEVKTVSNTSIDISFTDRIVFADASEMNIDINLLSTEEIYGIPLTIIRSDTSDNIATVKGLSNYDGQIELSSQNESVTVVVKSDNSINVINHFIPEQSPVISVNSSVTLSGYEKIVLADATSSSVSIKTPSVNYLKGKTITFKKIDPTGNPVLIIPFYASLDGSTAPMFLNSQWDYVTITSDGSNWFKVG